MHGFFVVLILHTLYCLQANLWFLSPTVFTDYRYLRVTWKVSSAFLAFPHLVCWSCYVQLTHLCYLNARKDACPHPSYTLFILSSVFARATVFHVSHTFLLDEFLA